MQWGDCLLAGLFLGISGCGSVGVVDEAKDGPPEGLIRVNALLDAKARLEPRSRFGNPRSYVVGGKLYNVLASSRGFVQRGVASWYGTKFHGKRTSNGEVYDMLAMSAAHRTLPLPTYLQVTNLENKRRILVRVNDRGPFHSNRIIDLSYAAAMKLGIHEVGTGEVEIRAVRSDDSAEASSSASSRLYLQIGAFRDRDNAEKLSTELRRVQLSKTRIYKDPGNGLQIYRVQFGPVYTQKQVDRLIEKLSEHGFDDYQFVTERVRQH